MNCMKLATRLGKVFGLKKSTAAIKLIESQSMTPKGDNSVLKLKQCDPVQKHAALHFHNKTQF